MKVLLILGFLFFGMGLLCKVIAILIKTFKNLDSLRKDNNSGTAIPMNKEVFWLKFNRKFNCDVVKSGVVIDHSFGRYVMDTGDRIKESKLFMSRQKAVNNAKVGGVK